MKEFLKDDEHIFFIAEIGKNFIQSEDDRSVSEYLENAMKLVDAAVEAGADAVKFQTHEVEDEVMNIDFTSPHFKAKDRYSWVTRNMNATPIDTFWRPLKQYCDEKGIIFFSTPMSRKAAMKLDELGVTLWKVGSGDVEDHVMLEYLIESKKPVIISTGMVSLRELDDLVSYLTGREVPLAVLYCVSKYPCPPEDFNLATIERFKEKHPHVVVGFSDHSITHEASLAAMKLGARIIEKHLSFSREHWGSDHKASLLPHEFKDMVDMARRATYRAQPHEALYGEKDRELEGAENQFRPFFNKALVAGRDIAEGEIITGDMVYAMRPVSLIGGLHSRYFKKVVGKKATRALSKFEPITDEAIV